MPHRTITTQAVLLNSGVLSATGSNVYFNGIGVGLSGVIQLAASDTTTAITAGLSKATFRMPFLATLTDARASVSTAPSGSPIIIDVKQAGISVFSTGLYIDSTQKTSVTSTTPKNITGSILSDDSEMTVDFLQVGSSIAGAGVVVSLFVKQ